MRLATRILLQTCCLAAMALATVGCETTGSGVELNNDGGSEPGSEVEAVAYKKALLRCYKTGGSRIVKISGTLRCY